MGTEERELALGAQAEDAESASEDATEDTAGERVSSRIFTVPNLLSFFRLLLVPVFLVFLATGQDVVAFAILIVSSVTDFFDGFLARRYHQVSKLGTLLDPAADRLYIVAALLGLAWRDFLPWWLVLVIIARDVMLAIDGIVLARHGSGPLPVNFVGKVGTFVLLFALPVLLLSAVFPSIWWISTPIGLVFAIVGAIFYWWAGFLYLRDTVVFVRHARGESVEAAEQLSGSASGGRSDTLDGKEVKGG